MLNRVNERAKGAGAMSRALTVRSLGVNVKTMMYASIVVLTVLHGAETWGLNAREQRT